MEKIEGNISEDIFYTFLDNFIKFYGPEYKDTIIERFNKSTCFTYRTPKNYNKTAKQKYDETLKKINDKCNKEFEDFIFDDVFKEEFDEYLQREGVNFDNFDTELIEYYKSDKRFSFYPFFVSEIRHENIFEYFDPNLELTEEVKEKRIEFFNQFVKVDYGTDYEAYVNNDLCKKYLNDTKRVLKIKKKRAELLKSIQNEEKKINIFYLDLKNRIKNIDISENDIEKVLKDLTRLDNNIDGFCIPYKDSQGKYKFILFVSIYDHDEEKKNYTLITCFHELNHIIEMVQLDEDNLICGWDKIGVITGDGKESYEEILHPIDRPKRENEIINEPINELISVYVKNINLEGQERENAIKRDLENSTYYHNIFQLRGFFDYAKDEIISSRMTGNFDGLYNRFGKENIDELFSLYDRQDVSMHDIGFRDKYIKGINNKATEYYDKFTNQLGAIYSKMQEYEDNKGKSR